MKIPLTMETGEEFILGFMEQTMTTIYPLKDGQKFTTRNGEETVGGEIKPPHDEPVCWTIQGNWYRRRDGEVMTGWNGQVMTAREFYSRKKAGAL